MAIEVTSPERYVPHRWLSILDVATVCLIDAYSFLLQIPWRQGQETACWYCEWRHGKVKNVTGKDGATEIYNCISEVLKLHNRRQKTEKHDWLRSASEDNPWQQTSIWSYILTWHERRRSFNRSRVSAELTSTSALVAPHLGLLQAKNSCCFYGFLSLTQHHHTRFYSIASLLSNFFAFTELAPICIYFLSSSF